MTLPSERTSREIRSGRINRRPPSFAVTLVALAIVFALAWMLFLRSGPSASAPVVQGIQGTYTWQAVAPGASGVPFETGSFSAVASGDAGGRMTWENTAPRAGTWGSTDSAYGAARRTTTTHSRRTSPLGVRAEQTVTIGLWPPAWRVATHSPLDYQGLAAVVRTAAEERDDAVGIKPLKDGERPVWRASLRLDGAPVELVVDQATGIVTWYSDGKGAFTAHVDWAAPPPGDETYAVDAPPGAAVKRAAIGPDYAASPAEAGRTAGYDPLVSGLAPDGYGLKAVATVAAEHRPASWISAAARDLPVDLRGTAVLQLYTRGLSQFTVEQVGPATLRAPAFVPDWEADARAGKLSFQETTLLYGAFRGATAATWYQASGPSLLVAGRRRAVFVTGALTRQELIAFAEGLKPVPAAK